MTKAFKGLTSNQMTEALAKHQELFKKLATISIEDSKLAECRAIAESRLKGFSDLKRGWYGHDELPFSQQVLDRAHQALDFLKVPYEVFPTFDGCIQFQTKVDQVEKPYVELAIYEDKVEAYWEFAFKRDKQDPFDSFYKEVDFQGSRDLERACNWMAEWAGVSILTKQDFKVHQQEIVVDGKALSHLKQESSDDDAVSKGFHFDQPIET